MERNWATSQEGKERKRRTYILTKITVKNLSAICLELLHVKFIFGFFFFLFLDFFRYWFLFFWYNQCCIIAARRSCSPVSQHSYHSRPHCFILGNPGFGLDGRASFFYLCSFSLRACVDWIQPLLWVRWVLHGLRTLDFGRWWYYYCNAVKLAPWSCNLLSCGCGSPGWTATTLSWSHCGS